ncbi:helix-turn-helix domain-containing protein [Vacuolonema iberomarrocanum]|uniref:helix-turn-helix domain-containing protein n=1 Tax=Vacuolonema iberomarrocanum TaxID=3454632 RepID=UPI0019E0D6E1|nr:helix-turn-helix domain-containing protein [filamentous cyanobacterium LEGE 07170]
MRKRFVLEGEAPALNRRPRALPPVPPKLDGEHPAHLVAICCSDPPQGRIRWPLTLLVNELKQRGIVTEISRETVRQSLKKINYALGTSSGTAFPKRVLSQPCLDQRIPDDAPMTQELQAWQAERNAAQATVTWQFSTADARIKLHHLYPSF